MVVKLIPYIELMYCKPISVTDVIRKLRMNNEIEKKEPDLKQEDLTVKADKPGKGNIKKHILAVMIGIAGLATIITLEPRIQLSRPDVAVLITGVACVCVTIWGGINIVVSILASVLGTGIILTLLRNQLLSPGKTPLAILGLIIVVNFLNTFFRKI